jgi:hypothetical protein
LWVYCHKNWSHSWTHNFFEEHPVIGSKHFNYLDFKSAVYIIKNKEHLNPDGKGLEQILQLKSGMNKAINNHSETGKEEI